MNSIFKRKSIRQFRDLEIEDKKIEKLLKAGMQAPSAHNTQPWEFIVVEDDESIEKIANMSQYAKPAHNSPCCIITLCNMKNVKDKKTEDWIAVGLTIGAYLNWLYVAPRLRVYTQVSNDSITIPSYLESRLKQSSRLLRVASGLIILLFFTFYVSSGMVAGGVFFESSFGLDYHTGLLVVSAVVVAYTLFGGFLAVSYTDFLQGLLMFIALIFVPVIGLFATGGLDYTVESIKEVNPNHLSLIAGTTTAGIISSLAWGLGYFGQPHIIVRFMAISSVKETKNARRIGIGWMILSLVGAISTAILGL